MNIDLDIKQISCSFLLVFLIALSVNNWAKFKKHYKIGLLLGVISLIFKIHNPFASALLESDNLTHSQITIGLLSVLFNGLTYFVAAAEWEKIKPYAFPLLWKSEAFSWAPIAFSGAGGVIIGVIAGFLTLILSPREYVSHSFYPAPVYEFFYGAIMITLVSLIEELFFRGALFAFLLRLSSRKTSGIVVSTIGVSFLWVIMHSSPIWIYFMLFIGGIVLCELARRWGIEAAIVAHCSYNVAITLIEIFWEIDKTFDHIIIGTIILGILLWAGVTIARKFTDNKSIRKAMRVIFILSFIIAIIALLNAHSWDRSEQTARYGVFAFSALLFLYLIKIISKIDAKAGAILFKFRRKLSFLDEPPPNPQSDDIVLIPQIRIMPEKDEPNFDQNESKDKLIQ